MSSAGARTAWLALAVRALLVFIGIGPFLPMLLGDVPVFGAVAGVFDSWFAFQCHREPGRSLELLGDVLPVCLRCFGIYVGLGLGALVSRPRLGVWPLRIWVASAALLMIADVGSEALGWRPPWPLLRLATGLLLAYPVGDALVWAARGSAASESKQQAD